LRLTSSEEFQPTRDACLGVLINASCRLSRPWWRLRGALVGSRGRRRCSSSS